MYGLARDRHVMGAFAAGRITSFSYLVTILLIGGCVGLLLVVSLT